MLNSNSGYVSLKDSPDSGQYEEFRDVSKDQPPYADSGIISNVFVSWLPGVINKIYHGKFDEDRDLWACAVIDRSENTSTSLHRLWKEELMLVGEENARVWRALWRYGKDVLIKIILASLCGSAFIFLSSSFCVNYLLQYADGNLSGFYLGMFLVTAMGVTVLGRILAVTQAMIWVIFWGTRVRNGIMALLFKKCLRIKDLSDETVGKLINTLSTDGERMQKGLPQMMGLMQAPLLLVAATVYACVMIGPMALVATAIFLCQFAVVILLAKKMGTLRRKAAGIADKRLKSISELLTCMKIIKVYAWENSFMEKIFAIRHRERAALFCMRVIQSLMLMSSSYALAFAQVVTIVLTILILGTVTPVEAFTLITLLNTMKVAMDIMPSALRAFTDILVAFRRIKEVLVLEEFEPPRQMTDPEEREQYCVSFDGTTFAHRVKETAREYLQENSPKDVKSKLKDDKKVGYGALQPNKPNVTSFPEGAQTITSIPALINMNFGIPKGKLVGICGAIGSGKSSMLQAILGRMETMCGKFSINGSIGYVAQEAWLNNCTVRDNILFGNQYDKAKYDRCIDVCCLKDDLDILLAGDQTEVGERGINLSGGQKQRISLARAVYSDRDVYLLDDPLSAVDNRVGSRIFSECIEGALAGKSVLLVTHQVRFLSRCDEVMFLKTTGLMAGHSHEDLMRLDDQYRDMINSVDADKPDDVSDEDEKEDEGKKEAQFDISKKETGSGKLTDKEASVTGGIQWAVVSAYIRASGGYLAGFALVFCIALNVASQSFPAWWISFWLEKEFPIQVDNCTQSCETIDIREDPFFIHNLVTYAASPLLILFTGVGAAFIISKITYTASTSMHNNLIRKAAMATMTFFDTTPIGQVQNRFTNDMDQMDSFLSTFLEIMLTYACLVIIIIVTVIVSAPLVTVIIVPSVGIFYYVWSRSRPSIRDLKRIENVARSPQYSMATSTVKGLTTITAFEKGDDFSERFCASLDRFHVRIVCFQFVTRWMAIRLDLVIWAIIVAISVVIVAVPSQQAASESGLALSFALQLSFILFVMVLVTNELIAAFTSVERVDDYLKNIPEEAPPIVLNKRPDPTWPQYGQILFHNFSLRYQPHLPRVLKDVTFRVDPMERIGIVGRTGAGKSTITTALFRLIEKDSGNIYIDGVDISTIGLRDLRRKLSLVPQDPVLFAGTVRSNVDPFGDRSDKEIWEALRRVNLQSKISGSPAGLEEPVSDGGANFSLGERQLICMARAILSQSRILLMDEATASVDPQTDALIQEAIKTSFPECTMLIIAHRLNTILDCDKILVMDNGEVAEYDTPDNLLSQKDSIFKQLLAASMK